VSRNGIEFLAAAAAVTGAGILLARAADRIAERTRLGRVLVGSLLLAAATSLPEAIVDIRAARAEGMPDLAVGDLLGSSLMNLFVLALLDLLHRGRRGILSRPAAAHALAATHGILLTAIPAFAVLTPRSFSVGGIGAGAFTAAVVYLLGARLIFLDRRIAARESPAPAATGPLGPPVAAFAAGTALLVFAGPLVARAAAGIAVETGLGGTFVGTTLVAFTTSLPELVCSAAAVRLGAFDIAVGNVLGSNCFNMFLLLPVDAAYPGVLLADVSEAHAVTALAVIVVTAVTLLGQLYRGERRVLFLEPDAVTVLLLVAGAWYAVYALS